MATKKVVEVRITDNSDQFKDSMEEKLEVALTAIGLTAEKYAKKDCPVDTGRLRNSITNAVESREKAVYIGTNVEYAAYVELGTSRMKPRPYLRPAAENHSSEYRKIIDNVLKTS